jgi:hypothetical protein
MQQQRGTPAPIVAAWIAWLTGALLLWVAAVNASRSLRLLNAGQRTLATIVDFQRGADADSVYPLFRFTDANGVERTVVSPVTMATLGMRYSTGERVTLLFDPRHPDRVQEDSFRSLWVVPLMTGVMGAAGLAAGTLVWRMRRMAA